MVEIKLDLPRYVTRRWRKGRWAYYFQVPKRLRPEGWTSASMKLPAEPVAMLKEAERRNHEIDALRGHAPKGHARGTLPWLIDTYAKSDDYHALSAGSRRSYGGVERKVRAWSAAKGHPSVAHMTRPHVLAFLDQWPESPSTRSLVLAYLKNLFRVALDAGIITASPVAEPVRIRMKRKREPHIWTDAEVDAILAKADEMGLSSTGDVVLALADTGQRPVDARNAKRAQIDGGVLRLDQQKTGAYVTIPLTPRVQERLAARGVAFFIFADEFGRPFTESSLVWRFQRIRKAAGLPHLTLRHLRHTCVVNLARAGCTVPEIASISGHALSSVHAILKSYWKADNEQAEAAIVKLEERRAKRKSNA